MKIIKPGHVVKTLFVLAITASLSGCGTPYTRDDVANLSNYEIAKCKRGNSNYRNATIKMCRDELRLRMNSGDITQQELSTYEMQIDVNAQVSDQMYLDALQASQPQVIRVQPGYAYPAY